MHIDRTEARGMARRLGDRWRSAGAGVRAANFLLAQDLTCLSAGRKKVAASILNVQMRAKGRQALDLAASLQFETQRADSKRAGGVLARSLVQREVSHFRRGPDSFVSPEWTVACDLVTVDRGWPRFELFTPPVLVEQHLVQRWIERTGDGRAASLPDAIHGALPMALAYLDVAEQDDGVLALDVAIPARGGALLGGIELVVAQGVNNGLRYDWARRMGGMVGGLTLIDPPRTLGRLFPAVSLRTFVPEESLTAAQSWHLGRVRDWAARSGPSLTALCTPPSRCRMDDVDRLTEFAILAGDAQCVFTNWRRRLAAQGHCGDTFSALRKEWHRQHPAAVTPEEARRRIASCCCVGVENVRLLAGMNSSGDAYRLAEQAGISEAEVQAALRLPPRAAPPPDEVMDIMLPPIPSR